MSQGEEIIQARLEAMTPLELADHIDDLISKAAPDTDAAMVVDWIPTVRESALVIRMLLGEFEGLREDYERLKTERMREVWKLSGQQSEDSSSDSASGSPTSSSSTNWLHRSGRRRPY